MKTLDRYIAGIFSKNLSVALIAMSVLFLFQSMFTDLYDHNYTIQQILIYHILNFAQIVVQMAAPSVLLATVMTLSGLARTQELVACYAIGFGLKRIMALILGLVLITCFTLLLMQDRVLPAVFRIRTNYKWRVMEKKTDFFLDIKRDKVWYRAKNMIYNLQRFDALSKTIFGMSVYTFDDEFNLIQMVGAEKAEFSERGWRMLQGTVTVFSPEDPFPLTKNFTEKYMEISETPKDFQEIEKEVDGLTFKELKQYITRMQGAGADTKGIEVKFHSRMSLSFIPLVMCFLAIPFSTASRREGSTAKDLGICLVFTFFYWLFYSVGLSLGTNGALPPWLAAWSPSMIFVAVAAALLTSKFSS
jgi:lipopolysaccharide export system permease protein